MVLGDVKLVLEHDGQLEEVVLDKNGKVTANGKPIGEVTAAGELKVNGKLVVTIDAEGRLTIGAQELAIRDDGVFVTKNGAILLEIGDDGTFQGLIAFQFQGEATITGDHPARRALMLAFLGIGRLHSVVSANQRSG